MLTFYASLFILLINSVKLTQPHVTSHFENIIAPKSVNVFSYRDENGVKDHNRIIIICALRSSSTFTIPEAVEKCKAPSLFSSSREDMYICTT